MGEPALSRDKRHDGEHQEQQVDEVGPGAATPEKKGADQKAGAAAALRIAEHDPDSELSDEAGDGAVGGPEGMGAGSVSITAGEAGMLTKEVTCKVGGVRTTLAKGTVVEVSKVNKLKLIVKVQSGFGGKEASIYKGAFKHEPALAHKFEAGHTDERMDFSYKEYTSILWDGAPKAGDVAQGYLGDCYLIAAMGAVAAANPNAIKKLFSPTTPNKTSYTVTLYMPDGSGGFQPHPVSVDTNLPTKAARTTPAYAMAGNDFSEHKTPIWPALLEKAYAEVMGGYDKIGDKGGFSDRAMEALTGVSSKREIVASTDQGILEEFKGFQKAGKAVVCGTLDHKNASANAGFTGTGDGPYNATLKTDQGDAPEITAGTLKVYDKNGKAPKMNDDGRGKLVGGGGEGTVGYDTGAVSAKYLHDKGPGKAEDLRADFEWRGVLDKSTNLHAWHAYIFESVNADNKLVFKNPWGSEHPNPVTPEQFRKLFTGINSNQVPKEAERKPK